MKHNTPPATEPPELVLLMQEPLVIDADFLRSAYQAVLGLKLDGGTEFDRSAAMQPK